MNQRPRIIHDARGAVYVEFLVAFLPVFVFFLCLLQLALLFSSKLLVDHAAVQGARAAAVVFGDEPGPYRDGAAEVNTLARGRKQAVRDAVLVSLAPVILDGSIGRVNVAFPKEDVPGGNDQVTDTKLAPMASAGPTMMRVRVEVDVVCKIAIANLILCAGRLGQHRVASASAEALYPYQGASYAYE
ncbi:MAG TPA: hypothetical protein VM925_06780 [Labilithrix sp.]|nr:hypothetical protein [Labilithrix sp.]